jgi:O-succinylbenzoic acid--CoA ligase
VAVVVPAGDLPVLSELRAWVTDRATPTAAPRAVAVVDAIPMVGPGKPDRVALRRLAAGALSG